MQPPSATSSPYLSPSDAVTSDKKSKGLTTSSGAQWKSVAELTKDLTAIASLAAPLDNPSSAAQSKAEIMARVDAFVDWATQSPRTADDALMALKRAHQDLSAHWRPDLSPEEQGSVNGGDAHTLFGLLSTKLYQRLNLATSTLALQTAVRCLPAMDPCYSQFPRPAPLLLEAYSSMSRIASTLWNAWGGRTDTEKTASINACLDALFDKGNCPPHGWFQSCPEGARALMTALVEAADLGSPADRELFIKTLAARMPELLQAVLTAIVEAAVLVSPAFARDLLSEVRVKTTPINVFQQIAFALGDTSSIGGKFAWKPLHERICKEQNVNLDGYFQPMFGCDFERKRPTLYHWIRTFYELCADRQKPGAAAQRESSEEALPVASVQAASSSGILPASSLGIDSKESKRSQGPDSSTQTLPSEDADGTGASTSYSSSASTSPDGMQAVTSSHKRKREE